MRIVIANYVPIKQFNNIILPFHDVCIITKNVKAKRITLFKGIQTDAISLLTLFIKSNHCICCCTISDIFNLERHGNKSVSLERVTSATLIAPLKSTRFQALLLSI